MQEDHCAAQSLSFNSSQIKKNNIPELENYHSQSNPTIKSQDLPNNKKAIDTNNNNIEEYDERKDLTKLNNDLRYTGFRTIDHICACNIKQFEEIRSLVYDLLGSREIQKDKVKDHVRSIHKMEYQIKRLQNKIESLCIQIATMQRQKEQINENIKQMFKQNKFKQQKYKKEIDSLLKQKKATENRELTIKNQFKKKDEKIITLENKLKKFLQKNDKTQVRNTFEVYQAFHKKGVAQPVNKQFIDHILLKSIEIGQKSLDNDNKILKDCLKYILSKLLKIVNGNTQDMERQNEINRSLNLLQLPLGFSQEVMKLFENLLTLIQENKTDFKENSFQSQDQRDTSSLFTAIQKMKTCYSHWQNLEQQRSNMLKQTFYIFNQKAKINQPALQRITNLINDPSSIQSNSYNKSLKQIEEIEDLLCQNGQSFKKGASFIRQKIQFIKRESSMMDILKSNMDQLLVPEEDLTQNLH